MSPLKRRSAAGLLLAFSAGAPASAAGLSGDAAFLAGNYASAFQEWKQEADTGDASAMTAIGSLYDTGHGVPQDFAQAFSWYRRAADAGNAQAMFNVGVMYDSGRGTAMSRADAVYWYRLAAAHGSARAAYNLGIVFRDGDGVPKDSREAIRYFRLAAADGLQAGRTNLEALGVATPGAQATAERPRSRTRGTALLDPNSAELGRFQHAALTHEVADPAAAKAFEASSQEFISQAQRGLSVAQLDLAYAYEFGIGRARDPVRAYVYYLRASSGSKPQVKVAALKGAETMSNILSIDQHAVARNMLIEDEP